MESDKLFDYDNFDFEMNEVDDDILRFQKDEIVKKALDKGVNLKNYSLQIASDLKKAEKDCITDFLENANEVASLYGQVKICDDILLNMQSLLTHFQSDLSIISS